MADKQTLIILSPGFAANEADTTCLPAQQQFVQNLQESFPNLNIIVLAFHYPYERTTYDWKHVQVTSFNGRNRGKLHRLLLWFKVWKTIKNIQRTQNIIGLFSFWCTECALIAQQFKLPHFIWILGQDAKKNNNYVKRIKPKAAQLVAMSDFLADTFERNHGIRPAHIIPNGIDARWYPDLGLPRTIDVLGVGSLIKLKQYDVFIELMHAIPGVRAVICGKGPEENALRERAGSVTLLGELPHPEVLKLMQQSKIFLHTSNYEGFSTVCLEALYAGAHVVSFCEPMTANIPHWHIVKTKAEMLQKLLELLNQRLDHSPVMPYSMKDTATAVMQLFAATAAQ